MSVNRIDSLVSINSYLIIFIIDITILILSNELVRACPYVYSLIKVFINMLYSFTEG
jgi:hypothetical protein